MLIPIIESVLGLLLIGAILVQQRAAGLSSSGNAGAMRVQRRGAEKALYQATILLSVLFFALIIVDWYV